MMMIYQAPMRRMKIILGMMNLQMESVAVEYHPVIKKILPSATEIVYLNLLALQVAEGHFHSLLIWAHFKAGLHSQS